MELWSHVRTVCVLVEEIGGYRQCFLGIGPAPEIKVLNYGINQLRLCELYSSVTEFLNLDAQEVTNVSLIINSDVGSHQVPFPMCTLETLQKYCSTSSLLLTFCTFYFEPLQSELSSNYELILYFCFCSFFHSYGSFNRDIFNILDLLWVSSTLFIHIITLFMYRKSSCTFICQVSLLTSSCQFSTIPQSSLTPQASLSFI